MKQSNAINGPEFRDMFAAATNWLEKNASDIDALNVFPVPDGDTGTNMLLTMRSTVEEAYKVNQPSVSAMAQAMANGALMGARGNSGVILSQIWSGLAQGLGDKETFNGKDLAKALTQASETAYKGLSNPVEGTILTVMKDASKAGQKQAAINGGDVVAVMEAAVVAAAESVASTPTLLPVLKEAGVVDAGGQGLFTLLDGALRYLRGEAELMRFRKPQMVASSIPMTPITVTAPEKVGADEIPFGYCTEFLLKGMELEPEKLKRKLVKRGQSLIVVGDDTTVRVHVHTIDPGSIIHFATTLGTVHSVSIRNMDEQHQDFLEMQKSRAPVADIEIVAVAAGSGLADVFTSLGVASVVPGGQTMNPSTKDILQAVENLRSEKIIILPNNKNIVMTAEKVQALTEKHIHVVPSKTIPQGIAALLAFDYEADFDTNTRIMTEALATIKTVEITRAVRATQLNGLAIKKKQAVGLLDGTIVAVADEPTDVLRSTLTKAGMKKAEVITLYYGDDTTESEAQQVKEEIASKYPNLQVEVVKGGQPHYNFIGSVE
ncbi:MAG: DAK2 domain-containing protein [Dehalococcoidia bacterium]|nr:MAG: DAK2 domain-containing protein [Dehalococcoidia bacterium]